MIHHTRALKISHLVFQPWSIQVFTYEIYPSIYTSCLVETTDYFNKTTFSVIRCLSLFHHSIILQFEIFCIKIYDSYETYDSRFSKQWKKKQTQKKPKKNKPKKKNTREKPIFFPFSKDIAVQLITFSNKIFTYIYYEILSGSLRISIVRNSLGLLNDIKVHNATPT